MMGFCNMISGVRRQFQLSDIFAAGGSGFLGIPLVTDASGSIGTAVGEITNQIAASPDFTQSSAALKPTLGRYPIVGRRNQITYSQEFDNVAWDAKVNLSVTANAVTAPDGTATADTITVTASTNTNFSRTSVIAISANTTFSIYAKKGSSATTSNRFGIRNTTTASDLVYADINYDTGAISYVVGASGVSVQDAGNGWWRISVSPASGISAGNALTIYCGYTGNAGVAGATWSLWGAQVEGAAAATAYQTVAAAYDITESGIQSITMPRGDGGDILTSGVSSFGNATSGLFADTGQNWTLLFTGTGFADGTIAAQCGATDADKMFQLYISSGVLRCRLRGTDNSLSLTANNGVPFNGSIVCTDGVVTANVNSGGRSTLNAGSAVAEAVNISWFARTVSSPASQYTGFSQPVVLIDRAISAVEETQALAQMKTLYGGP
jgi:hypothetical protein